MSRKIRILIADDHALLRRGLADLLRYEKDLTVVGEACDGEEAVASVATLKPDVVIMDLVMPGMNGVEATRRIKAEFQDVKILILTTFGTSADVARALNAGASGVVMKDASTDEQLAAIRTVAAGEMSVSADIRMAMNEEPPPEFTDRQRQILESVARGLTNRDIAVMLGISPDAVRQHVAAVCGKLGAANRSEAVASALRRNLLKL